MSYLLNFSKGVTTKVSGFFQCCNESEVMCPPLLLFQNSLSYYDEHICYPPSKKFRFRFMFLNQGYCPPPLLLFRQNSLGIGWCLSLKQGRRSCKCHPASIQTGRGCGKLECCTSGSGAWTLYGTPFVEEPPMPWREYWSSKNYYLHATSFLIDRFSKNCFASKYYHCLFLLF